MSGIIQSQIRTPFRIFGGTGTAGTGPGSGDYVSGGIALMDLSRDHQ